MKLIDPKHPFFAAAWRRWLTVLLPAAWAVFELVTTGPFWAVLFGAAAVYAFWELVVKWPPPDE
jgi:hypothetical protein